MIDRYYEEFKEDIKYLNDLVVRFMKDHPKDHFFIDELPVNVTHNNRSKNDPHFYGPDLTHLTGIIPLYDLYS